MSTSIIADNPLLINNPDYTLEEARRLFRLGLEKSGPTPLTALDRSLGLVDGDLDLDPPDDDLPETVELSAEEARAAFAAAIADLTPKRPATVGLMDFLLAELNAAYWRDRTPGQRASADYRRLVAHDEGE